MGWETCMKSSGKWCSLTIRGKKPSLGAEYEDHPGLLHKTEGFSRFPRSWRPFWVLVGTKRTPNDQVMTVLVNTGLLYAVLEIISFSRDAFWRADPNFVSCIVEILFPHICWPMPGMPSYYWLSHTYVMPCHTAKTRRISLIVSLFSWIYKQMGFPGW